MPPPSPARDERKEQLLAWQQQRQAARASPARAEQCRRSSSQASLASPERKTPTAKSTTATYTEQFLRRRRSEQLMADAVTNGLQSPKANGSRRTDRRRSSSADAAMERLNGPKPQQEELEPRENGHQATAVEEEDPAVEKPSQKTIDLVEDAAESGRGIAAVNGGSFGNTAQDEKAAVKVTSMAKKRKAPCSRSAVALAVVAGVVTVSVAGGIAVCRMYPSSPAAITIELAAERAKKVLYPLLVALQNEMGPYAKGLSEGVRAEWLALLDSARLEKAARAAQILVSENLGSVRGSQALRLTASLLTTLLQYARVQLQRAALRLADALEMLTRWVQTHLKSAFELMNSDSGARDEQVERVRTALKQGAEVARSSLSDVFEWIGLGPSVSDVSLPSEELSETLQMHQIAIQNIASGLKVHESRALQDVQRLEKRRVAIISAANSIIADTRAIALESVLDVKMAAVEFIDNRVRELAEQCAKSIEQEIEDYEHASREADEWNGVDALAEIAADIQAQVEAALRLKRELLERALATDEEPTDAAKAPVDDQLPSEDDSEEQYFKDAELVGKELPAEIPASTVFEDGSSDADTADSEQVAEEETPVVPQPIEKDQVTDEDKETAEYVPTVDVLDSVSTSEEQVQISAELVEPDLLSVQRTETQVVEGASISERVTDGDHDVQVVAELIEDNVAAVEVELTEQGEITHGKLKHAAIAEVVVEVEDIVLDVKQTQVNTIDFVEAENVSEAVSSQQDELQIEAHVTVPIDGAMAELVVELESAAGESTERLEVNRLQPDIRTRIGVLPRANVPEEKHTEDTYSSDLKQVGTEVEKELMADNNGVDVTIELEVSEVAQELKTAAEEADLVAAQVERTIAESASELTNGIETQLEDTNAQRQEVEAIEAVAATVGKVESLATERVVVAKEIEELEQLEQVILQEEGERVRVEEELRAIAEEEEVWLQSEQSAAEGLASTDDLAREDSSTAAVDVTKTADVDADKQSSVEIPAVELPGPTLAQISLLSVAFLALAVLAAYLLARRRKRGLFARASRRRRRWQRLADSDAEEVVLLPDDSSDDEEEADITIMKSSVEVVELTSSVNEGHQEVEEEKKEAPEDGGVAASDSTSKTVVVKRFQAATIHAKDHSATSLTETSVAVAASASSDDGDTAIPFADSPPDGDGNRSTASVSTPPPSSKASASVSTPPGGSPEGTPDTSERARRRLRRERRS
ncbi:hypothetical protein PHYSODRAFT_255777 [Phytophthora sojae]|uniref:Uncharacterized protein n=1 Tax=Phytophthora sojae (strain P6497) TaxID=1094619 RepID=G4ZE94_PHYSP|nr:hypothetical protein PHYSODRAFT_255777 [Phytophthora sojae]EGZ17857.1 hypothetical protein PHYSODRAFT_255777 [Phytophthora sojae]|eukprot:XP_009526915.1 hypothetical protein PHYSODRAFT_255777 [Phytophthora sojae]